MSTTLWTADIWYGLGEPRQPPAVRIRYSSHHDGSGSAELPATSARWETSDEAAEVGVKAVHRRTVIYRCPRQRGQDGQLDLFGGAA